VMASFQVEDFSHGRMDTLTRAEIEERYARFADLVRFSPLS